MKTFTIIAFAAASVFAATAATAEPGRTDIRVSYADLNLASPAGQASLTRRINVAASSACAIATARRDNAVRTEAKRCLEDAISGARTAIAAATTPVLASR